jgi:hypothetical protein
VLVVVTGVKVKPLFTSPVNSYKNPRAVKVENEFFSMELAQ